MKVKIKENQKGILNTKVYVSGLLVEETEQSFKVQKVLSKYIIFDIEGESVYTSYPKNSKPVVNKDSIDYERGEITEKGFKKIYTTKYSKEYPNPALSGGIISIHREYLLRT